MGVDNFLNLLEDVKEMSQEELTELVHAIQDRRNYLQAKDLEGFRVGEKVSWIKGVGISKETYTGIIEKVNRKSVGVKETGRPWMKWRISPSLLTKVKEKE
tara:strand:- start:266 stop:568 length:303 start_codon:yes stop_codon:yes gene_type:complete